MVLAASAFLAGCRTPPIAGTWKVDVKATVEQVRSIPNVPFLRARHRTLTSFKDALGKEISGFTATFLHWEIQFSGSENDRRYAPMYKATLTRGDKYWNLCWQDDKKYSVFGLTAAASGQSFTSRGHFIITGEDKATWRIKSIPLGLWEYAGYPIHFIRQQ